MEKPKKTLELKNIPFNNLEVNEKCFLVNDTDVRVDVTEFTSMVYSTDVYLMYNRVFETDNELNFLMIYHNDQSCGSGTDYKVMREVLIDKSGY